jgi:hypothetical protein
MEQKRDFDLLYEDCEQSGGRSRASQERVQHGYAFTSVTGAKSYSEVRSLGRLAVTTFIIGEKVLPEIFPGWL